ncbi:MAG TPA: hypothetical protein VGO50_01845 [Pyrinomonadaceae bacterium]|jgi:VanZ family protein|nr:hypothetical protein [Pyrinomonadaceae bacterium]
MKDMLSIGVGIIAVAIGAWQMYAYITQPPKDPSSMHLIIAIAAAVVAIVCGVFFMLGRVNKQEEIHITK